MIYEISRPNGVKTIVDCAGIDVEAGHLLARQYSGSDGIVAAFPPGEWIAFAPVSQRPWVYADVLERLCDAACHALDAQGRPILGGDPDFLDRPDKDEYCDDGEVCADDVRSIVRAVLAALAEPGSSYWRNA